MSVLKFYWNLRESMAEIVLDHCHKVLFCFSDTVTHSFTSSLMIIFWYLKHANGIHANIGITYSLPVCVWRLCLRMWLQNPPLCGALIKCGYGVTPCLRYPDYGATDSSLSCWLCQSHWQQGSSLLCSAACISGRTLTLWQADLQTRLNSCTSFLLSKNL